MIAFLPSYVAIYRVSNICSDQCSHLRSKLMFIFFFNLSSSIVWQIATIFIKMVSSRQQATVWPHSWVDWHSICIQRQPFSRTLSSQPLKSIGNCITIGSKRRSTWFHWKRLQWLESFILWCLAICYMFEPSHLGWLRQCWRKLCILRQITSEFNYHHHQSSPVDSCKTYFFSICRDASVYTKYHKELFGLQPQFYL